MLLGLSGMNQDSQISFEAIDGSQAGDGGVENGALLSRLCEAMFYEDADDLASVRDDVIEIAGAEAVSYTHLTLPTKA